MFTLGMHCSIVWVLLISRFLPYVKHQRERRGESRRHAIADEEESGLNDEKERRVTR